MSMSKKSVKKSSTKKSTAKKSAVKSNKISAKKIVKKIKTTSSKIADEDDGIIINSMKLDKKGVWLPENRQVNFHEVEAEEADDEQYEHAVLVFNMSMDRFANHSPYDDFISKIRSFTDKATADGDMNIYISTEKLSYGPNEMSDLFSLNEYVDMTIGSGSVKLVHSILKRRGVKKVTLVGCGVSLKEAKTYIPKGLSISDIDEDAFIGE